MELRIIKVFESLLLNPNKMPQGKLDITLKKANLTRDTEMFGSMSPYVIVTVGTVHEYTSKVKSGAGKSPDFKSEFCFFELRDSDTTEVKFRFFDKENFQDEDDFICKGIFDIADMLGSGETRREFKIPLIHENKGAGNLDVVIEFKPA